jgi:lysophospholipase L1-like esterase
MQSALGSDPGQILAREHLPQDVQEQLEGLTPEGLSATYATRNVARTIERLRAGQALTATVLGDSTAATGTPGNAAGAPFEKAAALVDANFPGSLTVTNRAVSGSTLLSAHLDAKVTTALADAADLYVFMFGRNDTLADITGDRTPGGYAREASLAALERDFASIRSTVDKADILVIGQGPSQATSVNDELLAWQADARALCAVWGVEYVDGYAAFSEVAGWETGLMYDTDHQNEAGNDLYAQTIAAHFPVAFTGVAAPASLPATKGLRNVAKIDRAVGNQGYVAKATPGTASGVTYTTGGTGWASEATSTVGDYVEASATYCTELFIDVDASVATAAVVDVAIDGVTVATDVTLSATGKPSAAVWLPATGLTPGAHSFRLTLKSGTLRTYTVAALMGAASSFAPGSQAQSLTPGSFSTVTLTGTYADLIAGTTIALPTGWVSMDVVLTGWVQLRNTSATTKRTANVAIRDTGADVAGTMVVDVPASSFLPVALAGHLIGVTSSRAVSVRARTTGTDLDLTTCTAAHLVAQLIRRT